MKTFVILVLSLALPGVLGATETKTRIHGYPATILTETSLQTPAACQAALDQRVDQQGWHDHIYRTCGATKAVAIYCQREADLCAAKEVHITLWRAIALSGKTSIEMRTLHLLPNEVNRFLDTELPEMTREFEAAPVPAL